MKVMVIGAGNMGLTFGHSFINASVLPREDIYFLDHFEKKGALVEPVSAHPLLLEAGPEVTDMDLVILAVKPQDFPELAADLKPFLRKDQLVLSIMAGISLAGIQQALELEKVVRAMPNLPAQVARGMTVFTASEAVTRIESYTVQNLLNTTGKTLYTEDEGMIDSATAVSGSGPAYVFYFMQSMIEAARKMGFAESEAHLLVRQTFMGGLDLLNHNRLSCEEWIQRVSSKGGTTEAAIGVFNQKELMDSIIAGMEAARNRAIELSQ